MSRNKPTPADQRLDDYEDEETECAACGEGVDTPEELEEMLQDKEGEEE